MAFVNILVHTVAGDVLIDPTSASPTGSGVITGWDLVPEGYVVPPGQGITDKLGLYGGLALAGVALLLLSRKG